MDNSAFHKQLVNNSPCRCFESQITCQLAENESCIAEEKDSKIQSLESQVEKLSGALFNIKRSAYHNLPEESYKWICAQFEELLKG